MPEHTVGADQFVYFDAAAPRRCLAPDAFVTLGVQDHDFAQDPVRQASPERMPAGPIAMTTLATLAGLAPLAIGIGAGAELQRSLALAGIGGLGLSSLLSTLALPSIAGALHRLVARFRPRPRAVAVAVS